MNRDFDERLRDTLTRGVPEAPYEPDRSDGARRLAARNRRRRGMAAAGAAAAVVAALVVAPVVIQHDTASGPSPANDVHHGHRSSGPVGEPYDGKYSCPRSDAAVPGTKGFDEIPDGAVAAWLCPSREYTWVAPRDSLESRVDTLTQTLNDLEVFDPPKRTFCTGDSGFAFSLTLQFPDGRVVSALGDTGGCGTVSLGDSERVGVQHVVDTYASLLREQRANRIPPALPAPECPSKRQWVTGWAAGSLMIEGTSQDKINLKNATACQTLAPGGPGGVDSRLTPDEVAALVADLDANSRPGPPEPSDQPCLTDPHYPAVVIGQNEWGDRFTLLGFCQDDGGQIFQYHRVETAYTWVPSDATMQILGNHLPAR